MQNEINVIPLSARYAADMAHIEAQCFSIPWTLSQINEELALNYSYYWAAVVSDTLVGYAGVHVILDEGYITNVAVHPDYRRHSIGSMLVRTLIKQANMMKLAFLTLEVRESNKAAIALYKGFGFKVCGMRPNYYALPLEDALLMTLKGGET